jgi:hypothetical protein
MNYYEKYIKYKTKYIHSKGIMKGGDVKTFDLNNKYEYKKGKLQKNLKIFEKEYGSEFKIKYENILIDVNFMKV